MDFDQMAALVKIESGLVTPIVIIIIMCCCCCGECCYVVAENDSEQRGETSHAHVMTLSTR